MYKRISHVSVNRIKHWLIWSPCQQWTHLNSSLYPCSHQGSKVALLPAGVECYESDLIDIGDLQASDLCDRAGGHRNIAIEKAENRGSWDFADPLTSAWSWCDSASNSCSLLQSFSCKTLKHCLRHSKENSVPHSAFFNRQSSQGAELSDLPESTQEVTHLGTKNGLWLSAFQHSFQSVSLFWREISIPFTFLWPPCFCW